MLDHAYANLNKPPDDRVYGRLDTLAPEGCIPDHVEQFAGNFAHAEKTVWNQICCFSFFPTC